MLLHNFSKSNSEEWMPIVLEKLCIMIAWSPYPSYQTQQPNWMFVDNICYVSRKKSIFMILVVTRNSKYLITCSVTMLLPHALQRRDCPSIQCANEVRMGQLCWKLSVQWEILVQRHLFDNDISSKIMTSERWAIQLISLMWNGVYKYGMMRETKKNMLKAWNNSLTN